MFRNAFRSAQAAVGASQPSPPLPPPPAPTSPSNRGGTEDETVNYSVNGSFDDEGLSPERLPFGKGGRSRVNGISDTSMTSEASAASGGKRSLKEAKQGMLLQIMGGQAMVEAKGYSVLDFDDMERLKQTHKKTLTRLNVSAQKLAVEQRMRDATFAVAQATPSASTLDGLSAADRRLSAARNELNDLRAQELDTRQTLHQHLVAVLGQLVLKQSEDAGHAQPSLGASLPLRSEANKENKRLSGSPNTSPFSGPHLFAGHRDATIAWSATSSPQRPSPLSQSTKSRTGPPQSPSRPPIVQGVPRELHEKIVSQLEDAKADVDSHARELDESQAQLNDHRILLTSAKSETERLQQVVEDLQATVERMRRGEESSLVRLRKAEDRATSAEAEANDLQAQLADSHGDRAQADSERQREVEQLRVEARSLELKCREAEDRANAAQTQARQAKEEVQRAQSDGDAAVFAVRAELEQEFQRAANEAKRGGEATARSAHEKSWVDMRDSLARIGSASPDPSGSPIAKFLGELPPAEPAIFSAGLSAAVAGQMSHTRSLQSQHEAALAGSKQSLAAVEGQLVAANKQHADVQAKLADASSDRTLILRESASLRARGDALANEVAELERKLSMALSTTDEVSGLHRELDQRRTDVAHAEAEAEALRGMVDELRGMAAASAQQATDARDTAAALDRPLRDVWRLLPQGVTLEARSKVAEDASLSAFRAAYDAAMPSPSAPPMAQKRSQGLGGILGYGNRNRSNSVASAKSAGSPRLGPAPPLPPLPDEDFSVERFVERVKALAETDKRLVERLVDHEGDKDGHKQNAQRAQKLVEESQQALRTYQQQVKELEERVEYADSQSATMLERLNDLTQSEESARAIARRAEASVAQLSAQLQTLTREKDELQARADDTMSSARSAASSVEEMQEQVQGLQDEIDDLREELTEVKAREAKARAAASKELLEAQDEVSSLKTRLRQAERARGKTSG